MPSTQQEATGVIWIEDDVLRAGFTQFPNVLLSSPAISASAKLVYLGLLSFAWQQGSCWPGQDTLSGRVALSRASVQRALYELKKAGLLVVTRRGQGMTNVYVLSRITGGMLKPQSEASGLHPNLMHQSEASRRLKLKHQDASDRGTEEDSEEQDSAGGTSNLRKQPTPDRSVGTAPAANLNGAIAPATPTQKPLGARLPPAERRRYDADRRRIVDYLSDFARELGDGAPLASSVTRAVNLMHRAGLDLEAFTEALYHARAVTKERWAAVRKEERDPGRPFPRKQAMAYFFAELEHALGLRALPETPAEHAARKEAEAQERRRERDRHPDWARARGPREWVQTYKPGEGMPAIGGDGGADEGA